MEKNMKKWLIVGIIVVLIAAALIYFYGKDDATGQVTGEFGSVIWLMPYEEFEADIFLDGELYLHAKQIEKERIKVAAGTHTVEVIDVENDRLFNKTVTLKDMEEVKVYIQFPLK